MNVHPLSRSWRLPLALLLLASLLAAPFFFSPVVSTQAQTLPEDLPPDPALAQPPAASAGPDFSVPPGYPARFFGSGAAPLPQPLIFTWDFEGDGVDDFRAVNDGMTTHIYPQAGVYAAVLTVTDPEGQVAQDTVVVTVDPQAGEQVYREDGLRRLEAEPAFIPPDGVPQQYAVMINGSPETRFWYDVTFMYSTLTEDYGFTPERIYLLNAHGTDPWGGNPDGMIDGPANTITSLDWVFDELEGRVDGDDHLFLWVTDHGSGYIGKTSDPGYGTIMTFASVEPGDEQDYLESEFVLKGLKLDDWFMWYQHYTAEDTYLYYRIMYVSHFTDLYFEQLGVRTDDEVLLERLYDYALGDTNRNGIVEPALGETLDYDGDGVPGYDPVTKTYDEGDWGPLDTYDGVGQYGVSWLSTFVPGRAYALFDAGFDGTLDIDLNYPGGTPVIDGTDLDRDTRFDFLDVNEDGDLDDWVSVDEEISVIAHRISDDLMADLVDRVGAGTISVFMLPCYSGGFIDDLSAPNRVISTAADEISSSYGNLFADLFTGAFHRFSRYGTPINADADGNGQVSMLEAFNYAAGNDYYNEFPQYDDNGDTLSQPYPVPAGGDGAFGATVYLQQPTWAGRIEINIRPKNAVNRIDLRSSGSVPVALLSAPGFNASTQVEIASLTFGHSGDEDSLLWKEPGHVPYCVTDDTNGDGAPDLVCSFSVPRTGFACGDTQGTLRGRTISGQTIFGQDSVLVAPCVAVRGGLITQR